ncbi:MAG: hypothetical protein WCL21_07205 [Mariniphaga sp.]
MQYPELLAPGKFYHIYNRGINSCDLFREQANYEYFLELYDKHISPIADTFAWVLMPNHFHLLVQIKEKVTKYPANPQGFNFDSIPNPQGFNFDTNPNPQGFNFDTIPNPQGFKNLEGLGGEGLGDEVFKNLEGLGDDILYDDGLKIDPLSINPQGFNSDSIPNPQGFNFDTIPNPQGFKNLEGLGDDTLDDGLRIHQPFSNLFNAYSKAFNKRYHRTGSLFEHPFKRKLIEDDDDLKTMIVYIHNNPVHHGFVSFAKDYPWSSYQSCFSSAPTYLQRDKVNSLFGNESDFEATHDTKVI